MFPVIVGSRTVFITTRSGAHNLLATRQLIALFLMDNDPFEWIMINRGMFNGKPRDENTREPEAC